MDLIENWEQEINIIKEPKRIAIIECITDNQLTSKELSTKLDIPLEELVHHLDIIRHSRQLNFREEFVECVDQSGVVVQKYSIDANLGSRYINLIKDIVDNYFSFLDA